MSAAISLKPRYIVNANRRKTHVVLTMAEYKQVEAILAPKVEVIVPPKNEDIYIMSDKVWSDASDRAYCARAIYRENGGIEILKDSRIASRPVKSMITTHRRERQRLINEGIIVEEPRQHTIGNYEYDYTAWVFKINHYFRNRSIAACIIFGGSKSGNEVWSKVRQ